MPVTVLTGPVASGKSRLAARLASTWAGPVVVIATAEALDDEMRERIERHRRERPDAWTVHEVPVDLAEAIGAMPPEAFAIVDCLTLWTSNLMGAAVAHDDIVERAGTAARKAADRSSPVVVVSNEVGWGIVPMNDMAREYRDLLGAVNRAFVEVSDRAAVVIAGSVVPLARAEEMFP